MLDPKSDPNFRKGDAKTDVFGSDAMLQAAPVDRIPVGPTTHDWVWLWTTRKAQWSSCQYPTNRYSAQMTY